MRVRLFACCLVLSSVLASGGALAQLPAAQDRPLSAPERTRLASLESQFVRISAQRNTSVAALRTIARAMGAQLTRQDPDQILKAIDERAQELAKARNRIAALEDQLQSTDSMRLAQAVSPLLGRAKTAIDEGRLDDAEAALQEAAERFAQARTGLQGRVDQLAMQEADIDAQRASVRSSVFHYRDAADLYAKAAELTPGADARRRWGYRLAQAKALLSLGQDDVAATQEAATLLRQVVLPLSPRAERPEDWAITQTELARALRQVGNYSGDSQALSQSVEASRAALEVATGSADATAKMERQIELGATLSLLGERAGDVERSREAVAVFKAAFAAGPPQDPRFYGEYGAALGRLGERAKDVEALRQSVEVLRAGAARVDRSKDPRRYAVLQSNAAVTLYFIGRSTSDVAPMQESTKLAEEALAAISPEQFPQIWAGLRQRVGANLIGISRIKGAADAQDAAMGIRILRETAEQLTRQQAPTYWAALQEGIAYGLKLQASRATGISELEEEISIRRRVQDVLTTKVSPQYWCDEQVEVVGAMLEIARRSAGDRRSAALQDARKALADGLPVAAGLPKPEDLHKFKNAIIVAEGAIQHGAPIPERDWD